MKVGWIKNSLCLFCLSLPTVLQAAATAQNETPGVLDRVQTVDNPELAELIRVAIETRKDINEEAAFEIIRKVTQSYAQITLLDEQIAEVSRKVVSATLADIRSELRLAKAELESKRTTEMANLRAAMGVIPRLPSPEQPIRTLNAWVSLQIIGDRVYVLDSQKPFSEYWAYQRWKPAGLLSEKETLDYVRGRLKDKESLPILFHIYYDPETKTVAEDLRNKVISAAIKNNAHMDAVVRLQEITWTGSGTSTFFVRSGTIRILHPAEALQRPDGGREPLTSGLVDPADVEQHILWRLLKPKNVPLTFRIEYDQASDALGKKVADTARTVVKRLGIADLAEVVAVPVEPIPETVFLGRWRAITKGDIQMLDIQPGDVCQAIKGEGTGSIKAGASAPGTWFMTTQDIVIDINDVSPYGPDYIYRGDFDEEGNLVIERGVIYPQGTFYESGPSRTILKRVQ